MCFDQEIHGVAALTAEILAVLATFSSEFSSPTCIKQKITLISRLRLDAQLFHFPVNEKKRGRKQIKGRRIHLKELLTDAEQSWQTGIANWYGGEKKTIEHLSFICLWYHAGQAPIPLRRLQLHLWTRLELQQLNQIKIDRFCSHLFGLL